MENIYEIGFLINPEFSQQEAEGKVSDMANILEKNSASVLSKGEAVDIELAYQIVTKIGPENVRFDEAYFAWVKFESQTSNIEGIKKDVDLVKKDYFRYMITKTIADDALTDVYKNTDEEDADTDSSVVREAEGKVSESKEEAEDKNQNKEENKEVEEKNENSSDDLTKIEGVGPKIAQVFADNGYATFAAIAEADTDKLKEILVENSLGRHNPLSWPKQAKMASEGKWEELKAWQDELMGGI